MRILIVEDLRIFVDHVFRPVLSRAFPSAAIEVVEDELALRQLMDSGTRFDVVLLDVYLREARRMPDLALLSRACNSLGERVVVHAADADPAIVGLLKEAGAFAYVRKNRSLEDLASTLGLVLGGNRFFPPHHVPPIKLTARQLEVLGLLANGMSDKRIANLLGVSVHTVAKYMSQLRELFCVDNRTALVLRFQALYAGD